MADSIKNNSSENFLPQSNKGDDKKHFDLTPLKEVGNYQSNKIKNISGVESEFAKHLKQKISFSIDHPYMGDKLKTSAWDHIHCTIRHARQGNVAMAKLHADIAGHALEEAAHYMKGEEYSELVFQVEECFIKSKKAGGVTC